MMIDTGAARNLIKQKFVNPEVPINSQSVLKLTGINDLPLHIRTSKNKDVWLLNDI